MTAKAYRQGDVWKWLRVNPDSTARHIAKALGLTVESSRASLTRMCADGFAKPTGRFERTTYYVACGQTSPEIVRAKVAKPPKAPKPRAVPHVKQMGPPVPQTELERCWGWYPKPLAPTPPALDMQQCVDSLLAALHEPVL